MKMTHNEDLFHQLQRIMLDEYPLYNIETGPVALALQHASTEQLIYIISQYTILPRELVTYMELCRDKSRQMHWDKIAIELEDNIAEELGAGNNNISHYTMLISGLEKGLGRTLTDTQPSSATAHMLTSIKNLFQHPPVYVLGTMYAVEKVSISELTLTKKIISLLLGEMPEQLQAFYDMHLDVWEIEHEADLRKSIADYITPADYLMFESGFRVILDIFDIWWRSLLIEATLNIQSQDTYSLRYIPTPQSEKKHSKLTKKSLGLDGSCYADTCFLENEKTWLFDKTWQFVGHESDAPNPGDYFTFEFMGEQILIIRAEDNELQAFHNVCTHRGAKLLDGKGHCKKTILCPYHSWAFNLQGQLTAIHRAQLFSSLNKSKAGLKPVKLALWRGLAFIKLEHNGEDLLSYLAGFPQHLDNYEYPWEDLREVDRWYYDEPVNWKFFIENYSESYHLTTLHAQSLEIFNARKIEAEASGLHHIIRMRYAGKSEVHDHRVFSGTPEDYSCQGIIFPNLMVNTAKDNVSFFRLIPLSPDKTRFEVIIYKTPQQEKEIPYDKASFRQEFDEVLQEDFIGVRRLQAAVRSSAYSVHQYADDIESGIMNFHANLKKYLQGI
jgi:phenylpropionate dioxygenase-like ring-hydroxylating dioxygenase large terminal subunit